MQTAASRKPHGERTRSLARKTKQKITFSLKADCSDLLQKKGERTISSETLWRAPNGRDGLPLCVVRMLGGRACGTPIVVFSIRTWISPGLRLRAELVAVLKGRGACALHPVCGAVSATFESNQCVIDQQGAHWTHEQIDRSHRILFENCLKTACGE